MKPPRPSVPGIRREPPEGISYVLDDRMQIVSVGGEWDRFALESGAFELVAPEPLGRPISSYVTDLTTAHLYDAIYEKVRRTGRPLTYPIRCDGPEIIRDLNMTVAPLGGGFLIRSVVTAALTRDRVPFPVDPPTGDREFVRSCGWCKRIDVRGKWVEIELAVLTLALFRRARVPAVSHGICDVCLAEMEAVLAG